MNIAVIGGGISGLAAAHRLHELLPDAALQLFETSDRLGGVLQTVHRDGFLIEHSADSFTTKLPWALDLCRRLGIADQLLPTDETRRRALVVCRGRLEPIPTGFVLAAPTKLRPILATRILSWSGKLRLLAEPLIPPRRVLAATSSDDFTTFDESVASFATRRLGREAFERLVQPLLSGIYTADAERLSTAAALPELLAYEQQYGSLFRGLRRDLKKQTTPANDSGARYSLFVAPRDGIGSLVDALVRALPAGCVQTSAPVTAIEPQGTGGWLLTIGNERPQSFDAMILAMPSYAAANLLRNTASQLATELAAIPYASCVVVNLVYDCNQFGKPIESFGFVVPQVEQRSIIAASFISAKFPGRAPIDRIMIRVFIGGALRPHLVELPTDQLIDMAHRELADLLHISGPPESSDVAPWPRSMPQYHVGHLSRVDRIESLAARLPAFALAGNAYRGVGIPQCIRSGEFAAETIARQLLGKAKPA